MGPTLNGMCTAAAAALVCSSGVCDPSNNACGYANGDGPCTAANGDVVCQSGACDTDGLCGYKNGDGPCTPGATGNGDVVCRSSVCDTDDLCGYANDDGPCSMATGSVVCRSGMCSIDLACEPAGGCNVDADCTGGSPAWCDESTHVCSPLIANGSPVPSDPLHTNPTLNGTCTAAAATLVCVSGVCDPSDDDCGYANGDGPCTAANGDAVCRSGACSANLTCEPAGGCNVDADCTGGTWCDESTHACTAQLANGSPVPSDPPHASPTLNGTCTAAAGTLVCASGVCDPKDNDCGYANGDGPCTPGAMGNGATVCRSTICGTTGANQGVCVGCLMDSQCSGATPLCDPTTNTCVQCTSSAQCSGATPICNPATGTCGTACTTDADCSSEDWCDAPTGGTGMCVPKLANGAPLPSTPSNVATCSASVGASVCASGVCDKDNACGYAVGDGPCTSGLVCRSTDCDTTTMVCVSPDAGTDAGADAGADAGLLPVGAACTSSAQCADDDCSSGVCGGVVIGSGNGLVCAMRAGKGGSDGDGAFGLVGLLLAAAGVARRRRGAA
jgi:hypothetical protein